MPATNSAIFFSIHSDHFFDSKERKRRKRKMKPSDVGGLNTVMKREQGVRQHHKHVQSKILPTDLIGV